MFPYGKTLETAATEPLMVVHTSGSTGIPKPLIMTHEFAARCMRMITMDPPDGFDSLDKMFQGKRIFMTFPPFHVRDCLKGEDMGSSKLANINYL